jgi:hypothetical protein
MLGHGSHDALVPVVALRGFGHAVRVVRSFRLA